MLNRARLSALLTRQIYKEFARTPCWSLFHSKLHSFSMEKDVLAGAPSSLLANYISRRFLPAFHIRVLMGQENDLIHQWYAGLAMGESSANDIL